MRLAILTTDTLHHRHFVRMMRDAVPDTVVFEEIRPASVATFATAHPFEDRREEHEAAIWFCGNPPPLADLAPLSRYISLSTPEAAAAIADAAPDVIVTFGTGRLKGQILDLCRGRFLNLHGGDPEEYRGLDTHLWAIYHNDFSALSTALHHVEESLDAGDIVATLPIPLHRGMDLHQLRQVNTEICVRLTLEALTDFARRGRFVARTQRRVGRYYSHMPSVLKELCVRRFQRHTEKL